MRSEQPARHYLSVYVAPPDATGLAAARHDHCVALWRVTGDELSLVRYWELERVSGLKHHRIPLISDVQTRSFLDSLLAEVGLGLADMTAIWGTPGLSTDDGYLRIAWMTGLPAHSLAHVFSSLLLDWDVLRTHTILALAVDAGPDWTLDRRVGPHGYAGCVAINGDLQFFPIESPGLLWYLARRRLGHEEGTLMALASATTCRVEADVTAWVRDVPLWSPTQALSSAERLLDRVIDRVRSTPVDQLGLDPRFSLEENLQSAIMKLVDQASAAVIDRTIERCRRAYDLDLTRTYLALSGGYALNCPNNTRVLDTYGFIGMLAPPCVNDGGQALGLGLMGLHAQGLTGSGRFAFRHAYHGNDQLRLDAAIEAYEPFVESVADADPEQALDDLAAGPVAWLFGASELGPRALGHRSLLGDPTVERTKHQINAIKQRQWWRPVAPIVLRSHVEEWFGRNRPSPYMLEAMPCRPDLAHRIPSALHLDHTARLQTVDTPDGLLFELVERFHRRTGVPMLCNTSLNDRGEPIVDDAVQAFNFCIRRGVSTIYVNGRRIRLTAGAAAVPAGPHPRIDAPFRELVDDWPGAWDSVQGRGLPIESVFLAATNPGYRDRLSTALRVDAPAQLSRTARLTHRLLRDLTPPERRLLAYSIQSWGPAAGPSSSGRRQVPVTERKTESASKDIEAS